MEVDVWHVTKHYGTSGTDILLVGSHQVLGLDSGRFDKIIGRCITFCCFLCGDEVF